MCAYFQAAQDAMDAEALDAIDMDDLQPGDYADWSNEQFNAVGGNGFISVSSFADEFPRDGRGFEPTMLVRHQADRHPFPDKLCLRAYMEC